MYDFKVVCTIYIYTYILKLLYKEKIIVCMIHFFIIIPYILKFKIIVSQLLYLYYFLIQFTFSVIF
jgi:hypothetical protein